MNVTSRFDTEKAHRTSCSCWILCAEGLVSGKDLVLRYIILSCIMGDHDQLMRSLRGKRGSQPNDEGSCLAALLRQEPRASASGSMTGSRSESSNLAALLRQRPAEVSSSQAAHDEEVQGGASLVSLLRPKRPRVAPVDEHSSLAALLASRGSEGYSKSSPRQTSPPHAASGQESGSSSDSSAFNLGWSRMSRFLD